jgi:RNA polymerase sigma-70 factor (ECF subfamily)
MYDMLIEYTCRRVSDRSHAQDIVQDTCLTAWVKIDSVFNSPNPKGWIINTLKNYIKKHHEQKADELRMLEPLTNDMPEPSVPFDSPDCLEALTSVLKADEIQIIELKAQGYKHREIANILGARLGTIDSAESRIRVKIAKLLED